MLALCYPIVYLYITMKNTTSYCRRFNIAMIWALGLCAVAVLVGVHYLSTLTINIFEL